MYIALDRLQPNRYQPRQDFNQKALEELADSIDKNGLAQPIVIRAIEDGSGKVDHEIIAGERRWRATAWLEKSRIAAILKKEATDESSMQLALIENIQREDLNPLEESRSINHFMDIMKLTQEQAADRLGKTRAYISNIVRIDKLTDPVKEIVKEGVLTKWHATVLVGVADKDLQQNLAKKASDGKWTVDTLKKRIKAAIPKETTSAKGKAPAKKKPGPVTANVLLLEAPSSKALKELIELLEGEGGWEIWEGRDALEIVNVKDPEAEEEKPKTNVSRLSSLRKKAAKRKEEAET